MVAETKKTFLEVFPLSKRTFKIMFFTDFFEKGVRGFWSRKRRKIFSGSFPLSIRTFKIMFFADFFEKGAWCFWSRKRRKKKEEVSKTKVKILVEKSVAKYIRGQTKHYGLVASEEKGDQVEMTFMTTDWKNGFSRWYLMFGDYAKIIEPEVLRERVAEILEKSQKRLSR